MTILSVGWKPSSLRPNVRHSFCGAASLKDNLGGGIAHGNACSYTTTQVWLAVATREARKTDNQ